MAKTYPFIGMAVVAVIVLFIAFYKSSPSLDGFWEAPSSFCLSSGLKVLYLCIEGTSGYVFALNDSGVLVNQPIDLEWNWNWSPTKFTNSETKGTLTLSEELSIWPSVLKVTYKEGRLMFTAEDTIYAVLHKNPEY